MGVIGDTVLSFLATFRPLGFLLAVPSPSAVGAAALRRLVVDGFFFPAGPSAAVGAGSTSGASDGGAHEAVADPEGASCEGRAMPTSMGGRFAHGCAPSSLVRSMITGGVSNPTRWFRGSGFHRQVSSESVETESLSVAPGWVCMEQAEESDVFEAVSDSRGSLLLVRYWVIRLWSAAVNPPPDSVGSPMSRRAVRLVRAMMSTLQSVGCAPL